MRYSKKRKEAVIKKMMAPHDRSIKELAVEEGISEPTLYNWQKLAGVDGIQNAEAREVHARLDELLRHL